jgi:uncharacterized membrane protein YccF (DUF307 family)
MKTLGNILWHFPFFGFIMALYTFIIGLVFTITVVGAPIGLGMIQHSKFLLTPFSKRMISDSKLNEDKSTLWKVLSVIAFIVYLPFGILASIVTIIQICLLFITIVGIPVALVLAKSLSTYFNPIGKVCVDSELVNELNKRKAKEKADRILNQ